MVFGSIAQKRRYREYRARAEQLPLSYRTAFDAFFRYFNFLGGGSADAGLAMLGDLVDLLEQGAASGTPIREIVGADPVEFADAFLQNYPRGQWIHKERRRLSDAIDRAEESQPS